MGGLEGGVGGGRVVCLVVVEWVVHVEIQMRYIIIVREDAAEGRAYSCADGERDFIRTKDRDFFLPPSSPSSARFRTCRNLTSLAHRAMATEGSSGSFCTS